MASLTVAEDLIRIDAIGDDAALQQRLRALRPGETIDLDVGGTIGRWERTVAKAADGTTADAIRPVGLTQDVWREMRANPRLPIEIHVLSAGMGLAGFGQRFLMWDIPENQIR